MLARHRDRPTARCGRLTPSSRTATERGPFYWPSRRSDRSVPRARTAAGRRPPRRSRASRPPRRRPRPAGAGPARSGTAPPCRRRPGRRRPQQEALVGNADSPSSHLDTAPVEAASRAGSAGRPRQNTSANTATYGQPPDASERERVRHPTFSSAIIASRGRRPQLVDHSAPIFAPDVPSPASRRRRGGGPLRRYVE